MVGRAFKRWTLMPASGAKVLPTYVPEAIRQDYEEACLIKELSPRQRRLPAALYRE